MMKIKLSHIALAVALASGATLAVAAEKTEGQQPAPGFAQLDANSDGYISKDEAAADATLVGEWSKADTNKDGQLDKSEFSALEMAPMETHK